MLDGVLPFLLAYHSLVIEATYRRVVGATFWKQGMEALWSMRNSWFAFPGYLTDA